MAASCGPASGPMVVLRVPFCLPQVLAPMAAPCPSVLSLSTSSIPKTPRVQVPFRLNKHLSRTWGTVQALELPQGTRQAKPQPF